MIEKREPNLSLQYREMIQQFEHEIGQIQGAVHGDSEFAPLTHMFAPGIYVRQIFLPKGSVCVGKIHRHEHPNFLMSGRVRVVTEDGGMEELVAPMVMISPAKTKRAVYALEDTVWVTCHATNETDLDKIEEEVIAKTYEELESKEMQWLG